MSSLLITSVENACTELDRSIFRVLGGEAPYALAHVCVSTRRIEVKWAAVECRPRSFRGLLEAAVKPEYAFVTTTSASCERLEIGRERDAAVTLRGMKRTASDAPLEVFLSRDTGHLVTSPFASGRIPRKVAARVCFTGNHRLSDQLSAGRSQTSAGLS